MFLVTAFLCILSHVKKQLLDVLVDSGLPCYGGLKVLLNLGAKTNLSFLELLMLTNVSQ